MKRVLLLFSFFLATLINAQTKAGDFQFNDIDTIAGTELMLNGAGLRDKLYAIALYTDFEVDGVEDAQKIVEKDETMAVTLKILNKMNSDEFNELLRMGLERATDGNSYQLEDQIRKLLRILPKEINKYETFKLIHIKGDGLHVLRNKEELGVVKNLKFKQALFKIWLGDNPVDEKLKVDLLNAVDKNPVLGKWKTYHKKTGVAKCIVQLYIIDKMVFGVIDRMLRESDRDAVCYDCEGDDKNQKVEGLVIIKNLRKDGKKYANGKYTNIEDGNVSECQVWIDKDNSDILHVKYKGGGSHEWKRVKE